MHVFVSKFTCLTSACLSAGFFFKKRGNFVLLNFHLLFRLDGERNFSHEQRSLHVTRVVVWIPRWFLFFLTFLPHILLKFAQNEVKTLRTRTAFLIYRNPYMVLHIGLPEIGHGTCRRDLHVDGCVCVLASTAHRENKPPPPSSVASPVMSCTSNFL